MDIIKGKTALTADGTGTIGQVNARVSHGDELKQYEILNAPRKQEHSKTCFCVGFSRDCVSLGMIQAGSM